MDFAEEIKRLTAPPPPVPSFWRYAWRENPWAYYNVSMGLSAWIVSIIVLRNWWLSLILGILAGASVVNAFGSWKLWRKRKRIAAEDVAWVEEISSGERAFPRAIAQAMANLIAEDKVNAAAHLALEYLKETDPETARRVTEFDALPEDERERRVREALLEAEKEVGS